MKIVELLESDLKLLAAKRHNSVISNIFSLSGFAVILVRISTLNTFFSKPLQLTGKLFLKLLFNIEVNRSCKIGYSLLLPHPRDIIIGATELGDCCTIMHGVTLGSDIIDFQITEATRPVIGNNVILGINSVILGGGKINNNTTIRPNTYLRVKDYNDG